MKQKNIFSLLSVCLISGTLAWRPNYSLDKSKVALALNCGSDKSFKSSDGFIYEADQYFREGVVATYQNHPKVPRAGFKYTRDHKLHRTERYNDKGPLEYDLPVIEDGQYVLILQFAEVNFERTGQRVVDIMLGDTVVRPNHDTLKAGRVSSLNIYIPFELKDDQQIIYAGRVNCQNAFDTSKNRLRLKMVASRDNPKVDGIILFKGTIDETNFYEQDNIRRYFDRKSSGSGQTELLRDQMMKEYMQKKRMRRKVRNDFEEHDEFEMENIIEESKKLISKKLIALGIFLLFSLICTFNRRKGPKNPIILVRDKYNNGSSSKAVKKENNVTENDNDQASGKKKKKKNKKKKR